MTLPTRVAAAIWFGDQHCACGLPNSLHYAGCRGDANNALLMARTIDGVLTPIYARPGEPDTRRKTARPRQ